MEFVHENSRLFAAGSNQRMQFASQFLFVTRGRLNVGVDDDGRFCHESRNELKKVDEHTQLTSYLRTYKGVKQIFP